MKRGILSLALLFCFLLLVGCGNQANTAPVDLAKKLLGTSANNTTSSFQDGAYDNQTGLLSINYHFFPVGVTSVPEEIGIELSPFFQKFYKQNASVKSIKLTIALPYTDKYGNTTWEQRFTLELPRSTAEKINWDNFSKSNLTSIADFKLISAFSQIK